jgi:hypothetical protein
MKKLVQGVGINDVDYLVLPKNGAYCPFYRTWNNVLIRCYSPAEHKRNPAYIGCYMDDEFLTFSTFKDWMINQDWEGKELDKDLLIKDNKRYSKESCIFIPKAVNMFMTDKANCRGDMPIGVVYQDWCKMKYTAQIMNPFTKKRERNLGRFSTPEEAHLAWKKRKHMLSCELAEQQTDPRVAEALRTRYIKK